MRPGTIDQWVVDAVDPSALARFWAELLGGDPVDRPDGWSYVDPPGAPRLSFQPTDEPKRTPHRVHADVRVTDIAESAERLLTLGATAVGETVTDAQGAFRVMRDPEGNEFCLVRPTGRP
ncbi:VOC family protein [Nocardiopsis alba]|uniref:VOC family protein n=1 Tax=Nocardiopsis alba TaxID=53437 RepID=UPI00366ACF96